MAPKSRSFYLPLGVRLFFLIAGLVAAAVAVSVGVTSFLGQRVAREAAGAALSRSASVQSAFEEQRADRLRLIAYMLLDDPYLKGYLLEAIAVGDVRSVLDLLDERQGEFGFDFAMVLDASGRVFARTDDPNATGEDYSQEPFIQVALEEFEAYGVWSQDGQLYDLVAVPIVADELLQGFVLAGFAIDDLTALEVRRASDTEVAFAAIEGDRPVLVGSTLEGELADALTQAMARDFEAWKMVMEEGRETGKLVLALSGGDWLAQLRPLTSADGVPVGAAVALASLAQSQAGYRRIQNLLLLVGLAAVVLASILAWALARRLVAPIKELASAAVAASRGDYDQEVRIKRSDEVGRLSDSFEKLLSELREKRDMESYVGHLQRTMPEQGAGDVVVAPEKKSIALLAIELRRYARASTGSPSEAVERYSQDIRRIANAVSSARGRVEATFGHRVMASFEGSDGPFRALTAAGDILPALSAKHTAFDSAEPPVACVVFGEAVRGSVVFGESTGERLVIGLPVQQLESLLREASPGDLVLSEAVFKAVEAGLAERGVHPSAQRGVLSTQAIYLLDPAEAGHARRSVEDMATALTQELGNIDEALADSGRPSAPAGRKTLSDLAPGATLGHRFEILSILGAGGMGVVYKVRDRELDDLVALKMLKRDIWDDPGHLERLKSELKLARKITHPNVLRTFDFGEVEGIPFITMEYVRGITLRYLLDQSDRLPYSAALRISRQLAMGLEAAHSQGVLHRDIKPENLIIETTGNVKLMDFGIARPVRRSDPGQTQPGTVVGTPHYLSPEQLTGKEPDERADIYASGVVLYELFTGRLPFTGATPMEVVAKHIKDQPLAPSQLWPQIDPRLEKLILECLAKEVERRLGNARLLLQRLEQLRA